MSAKNRNPFLDGATSVVKGAICQVLNLPTGRSTKSVAFEKNMKARLTIGPVTGELDNEQKEYLNTLIKSKILEDAEFGAIKVNRAEADKRFGDAIYDDFGVPQSVTELRLVFLNQWNINANVWPVIKSTGVLNEIVIEKFKFTEAKQALEITFQVNLKEGEVVETPLLVEDTAAANIEQLPTLEDVSPPGQADYNASAEEGDDKVTPWEVAAGDKGVDYDKLIKKFGCSRITPKLVSRIEEVTGQRAHRFLRRGLFFSHRDLDTLLNAHQKGMPFYLYTGRGPASEALHLGHLIPFMFTKYLQDVFGVPLVIQLSDDEKFLFKDGLTIEETARLGFENAKDIIACGFNPELTFIFRDTDYIKELYPTVLNIQKKITYSTARAIFGFNPEDNIGKSAYPAVQAAPSFPSCFPTIFGSRKDVMCLVPQAIDQDPYFRITRDIAPKLGFLKPAVMHSQFLPALQGAHTKMSGSVGASSLFVTDDVKDISKKVFKYAFSGGQETQEKQRELGANLEVDVAYQYLKFLLEDDEELERIGTEYKAGRLMSSDVKQKLVDVLQPIMEEHQRNRKLVTDDVVRAFMNPNNPGLLKFKEKHCSTAAAPTKQ